MHNSGYNYLRELIRINPREAARIAEDYDGWNGPDLAYNITYGEWMNILLEDVDWERDNPPRKLGDEEEEGLPDLMSIMAVIPNGHDLS